MPVNNIIANQTLITDPLNSLSTSMVNKNANINLKYIQFLFSSKYLNIMQQM